jgi:hypothetical protein
MKIRIQVNRGGSTILDITESMTVQELKAEIEKVLNVPTHAQKLILFSTVLGSDQTKLSEYHIKDNDMIFVLGFNVFGLVHVLAQRKLIFPTPTLSLKSSPSLGVVLDVSLCIKPNPGLAPSTNSAGPTGSCTSTRSGWGKSLTGTTGGPSTNGGHSRSSGSSGSFGSRAYQTCRKGGIRVESSSFAF